MPLKKELEDQITRQAATIARPMPATDADPGVRRAVHLQGRIFAAVPLPATP